MKKKVLLMGVICFIMLCVSANAAYHHMVEPDGPAFQAAYPDKVGTKIDDCALCHSGAVKKGGMMVLSSCQNCHEETEYGTVEVDAEDILNQYGLDYLDAGRDTSAFTAIESLDSDNDTYSNIAEITATRFPGNADDDPSKKSAPYIILTLSDLENEFTAHTQFMLMNTSRSGDYYATYTGVPMEDLLAGVGARSKSTSIDVIAPDGFHFSFGFTDEGDNYFINGEYPTANYFYESEADTSNGGWCDYSATGNTGRTDGQAITNADGNKLILAYKQDGAALVTAELSDEGKLDGDGPFRVVPPQWNPGYPDRLSTSDSPDAEPYPYDGDEVNTDHNGGFSARGTTAIRVDPLPDGTTDYEWQTSANDSGWDWPKEGKIVIYGNLRSGDVSGVVTDSATGLPIANAKVAADRGGYETLTDDNGTFILVGMVAGPSEEPERAEYKLKVTASGYRSSSEEITIANKEEIEQDFTLTKGEDCPIEVAAREDIDLIAMARDFRDNVLAKNDTGKRYAKAYYSFAPEVAFRVMKSGSLKEMIVSTLSSIKGSVKQAVSGKTPSFTSEQKTKIMELSSALKKGSSLRLKKALGQLENDLSSGTLEKTLF